MSKSVKAAQISLKRLGGGMSVKIDGQLFYRTKETCEKAGISRSTLFRWLNKGILQDVKHRDRRGWRLFTEEDIERLKEESSRFSIEPPEDASTFVEND
ncbi:helix-turn-helix domain-containing protein [Chloroflexota bacterium]